MSEDWVEKHSVNCYFCGKLVDERECYPADEFNDNDGGDCCPECLRTKNAEWRRKKIDELQELYGGYWKEHPGFPRDDWKYEVDNEDTNQGYWEWLLGKIEEKEEDQDKCDNCEKVLVAEDIERGRCVLCDHMIWEV